jgi:tRNA-2-methylthio-N6-dimethylallyladenosine synthase
MIIGFPGETDADFAMTMQMLETVRFHGSFSFKYSDRPGTRAATFDNPVDEKVKSERLTRFQCRQDEISLERNREYIGTACEVIVEGEGKNNLWHGRSESNHIVHFPAVFDVALHKGDLVKVRISNAGQHALSGIVMSEKENKT